MESDASHLPADVTTSDDKSTGNSDEKPAEADDRMVKSEIINGWFNEWIEVSCGGHASCLQVDQVLFHEQSQYQDVLIFKR